MRRIGRLVFVGPFVIAFSRGRMGYHQRWRHLRWISGYFKIVIDRCEWCNRRRSQCDCFEVKK